MILSSRLHIEGHPKEQEGIPLLTCNFSFDQDIDQRGYPTSTVKGGVINLSFVSEDDSDILQWMFNREADKNGKIVFASTENTRPFKTLEFTNARLVHYDESFTRDVEMIMSLTISTRTLEISGATHINIWTGYDAD
jgi:hypothetical protein